MKIPRYATSLIMALSCMGNAQERTPTYATDRELLATNTATSNLTPLTNSPSMAADHEGFFNAGYTLAYTSETVRLGERSVEIRVWDKAMKSWPGNQPQIIQIVDATGRVLAARKVGGEPLMTDTWIAADGRGNIFVYIKCKHRHRNVPGAYIYRVDDTLAISDQGIYFDKSDIEKEQNHLHEMMERFKEDRQIRSTV